MLTDKAIRNAKPRESPYKLADGEGLTLLIRPNGSKLWRFRYRASGREKMLGFGSYPDTSIKLAREKRDSARKLLARNVDPSGQRQAEKMARCNTFEAIAREWLTLQEKKLAPATYAKAVWTLETIMFPFIGGRPIDTIKAVDVLRLLKRIEARGLHETAHRTRQRCGQVFRYGVVTERCERDVTTDLRGALAAVVSTNHASITDPAKIGELLRDIETYRGNVVTWYALRIAAQLFVRPGELRHAEWPEFDLEGSEPEWRIPASKMKMREQHIVPLSKQVVVWLTELRELTGNGKYVFPSLHSNARPISENTVNVALRRMGYDSETMTGHGFRSMASTCLNEQGWHPRRDRVTACSCRTEQGSCGVQQGTASARTPKDDAALVRPSGPVTSASGTRQRGGLQNSSGMRVQWKPSKGSAPAALDSFGEPCLHSLSNLASPP